MRTCVARGAAGDVQASARQSEHATQLVLKQPAPSTVAGASADRGVTAVARFRYDPLQSVGEKLLPERLNRIWFDFCQVSGHRVINTVAAISSNQ